MFDIGDVGASLHRRSMHLMMIFDEQRQLCQMHHLSVVTGQFDDRLRHEETIDSIFNLIRCSWPCIDDSTSASMAFFCLYVHCELYFVVLYLLTKLKKRALLIPPEPRLTPVTSDR